MPKTTTKTKKTPPKEEGVFTREDFLKALDKVIAAPIPQEQMQKKQPGKVKSKK